MQDSIAQRSLRPQRWSVALRAVPDARPEADGGDSAARHGSADGSISVRLIRGQLSNNIASHLVELHFANGRVLKVNTDDAGRAQFDKVPAGERVKATADVDGEHLESQDFPAPSQGGIRLMLVATDKNAPAPPPEAPAVSGGVTLGENSRIVFEPGTTSSASITSSSC